MNKKLLLFMLLNVIFSCDSKTLFSGDSKSDELNEKAMSLYHDVVVNFDYTEENYQKISKLLEEAISKDKNNWKIHDNLKTIYINFGKYEKAINLLLDMSERNLGEKYKNLFMVGRIIEGIESRDSASYYYNKSISEMNSKIAMDSSIVHKINKATLILAKKGKNEALNYLDSLNNILNDTNIVQTISILKEAERDDIIELYIKDKEVE